MTQHPLVHKISILLKNKFGDSPSFLLACSGGKDSITLAHVLLQCGFSFTLAHVNFGLRGEESDVDQMFVENWGKINGIPVVCTKAPLFTSNIQVQARTFRYAWLNQMLAEQKFDAILTAHHAQDVVETFFINLLRSAGISGLRSIPRQNGKVFRPFLNESREELDQYANQHTLNWRTDSSNVKTDYLRNKIRLYLLPQLTEIDKKFTKSILRTIDHITAAENFIEYAAEKEAKEYSTETGWLFPVLPTEHLKVILHHILKSEKIHPDQMEKLIVSFYEPGTRNLFGANRHFAISKGHLQILQPKSDIIYTFHNLEDLLRFDGFSAGLTNAEFFHKVSLEEVMLDVNSLQFPLFWRLSKAGDRVKPLGMQGSKLVSDVLIDKKIPSAAKSQTFILEDSTGNILWIPRLLRSSIALVNHKTESVLHIKL